jgi:AbrB family looped-hinge helix DNA binding protein
MKMKASRRIMNQLATIGKSGRLVIPAKFRKALGLEEGAGVMIAMKNGHIEISPVGLPIREAQKKVARYLNPGDDLVKMLLEERKKDLSDEH